MIQNLTNNKSEQSGFLPLTEETLNIHAPSGPGLYMLAIRMGKDGYFTFHVNQTDNLYEKLRRIVDEHDAKFGERPAKLKAATQCYVMFFPLPRSERKCEVEKLFLLDEAVGSALFVINCN